MFTTISIDFNNQNSFPLCWGVGVANFGKVRVRIFAAKVGVRGGYFYLRLRNPDSKTKECLCLELQV